MRSWGKVSATLTVPLAGGGTAPVDRVELAAWLRKIGTPMAAIADAMESAVGDEATAHVSMSAEDADAIRQSLLKLEDKAVNPPPKLDRDEFLSHRAAAPGLHRFYRAWVDCTGWQASKQVKDRDGSASLGSGYAR